MEGQLQLIVTMALIASVASMGLGIACLVQIRNLERLLRTARGRGGRGPSRLMGRGRLVPWPVQPPRNQR